MSRSSFSKAYEEIANLEPMEMTFTIKDADLDKLNEILKDINVKECPWFEVQDKHGNKAKYYRETRKNGKWIGKEKYMNSPEYFSWQCSVCGCVLEDPTLDKPYSFCPICGSYNGGEEE